MNIQILASELKFRLPIEKNQHETKAECGDNLIKRHMKDNIRNGITNCFK